VFGAVPTSYLYLCYQKVEICGGVELDESFIVLQNKVFAAVGDLAFEAQFSVDVGYCTAGSNPPGLSPEREARTGGYEGQSDRSARPGSSGS